MKKKVLFPTGNMTSITNKVPLQIQAVKSWLCSGGGTLLIAQEQGVRTSQTKSH